MFMAALLLSLLYWIGAILVDLLMCAQLLHERVWKPGEASRPLYGPVGRVMQIAALMICAAHWGWNIGLLIWIGLVVVVTLLIALVLPRVSRLMTGLGPQSLVLGSTLLLRLLG